MASIDPKQGGETHCPRCKSANPLEKKFCGDCGALLTPVREGSATFEFESFDNHVKAILDARVKDQKVLEIETAQAILTRVSEWVKLFGFFVAIPLGLLTATFALWGISSFVDFRRMVNSNRQQIEKQISEAKASTEQTKTDADALRAQYAKVRDEIGSLPEDVKSLRVKVDDIEERIGFVKTKSLTPQLQKQLSSALEDFRRYCRGIGFKLKPGQPKVRILDNSDAALVAYYDPAKEEMVVSQRYASDPTTVLREYTHRILLSGGPSPTYARVAVESGLACYYPASFRQDSHCGSFDMREQHSFSEPQTSGVYPTVWGIHVWGGVFWELRQLLGPKMCDRLLYQFWTGLTSSRPDAEYPRYVASELVKAYREMGGTETEKVRNTLSNRGLQF